MIASNRNNTNHPIDMLTHSLSSAVDGILYAVKAGIVQVIEVSLFSHLAWSQFPYFLRVFLDGPVAAELARSQAVVN